MPNVDEEHPLKPLTDYSKFKAMCEPILLEHQAANFTTTIIRPATVCGYSPRQRLDLTVNILTNLAVNTGRITVFGGTQKRPNIHIDDMADLYVLLLEKPDEVIAGQVLNAGYQNDTVADIAKKVRQVVQEEMPGRNIEIVTTPSDDLPRTTLRPRESRRCSAIRRGARFRTRPAIWSWPSAPALPDSLTDKRYFNIKTMQALEVIDSGAAAPHDLAIDGRDSPMVSS